MRAPIELVSVAFLLLQLAPASTLAQDTRFPTPKEEEEREGVIEPPVDTGQPGSGPDTGRPPGRAPEPLPAQQGELPDTIVDVEDPMLTPLPRAKKVVSRWQDALAMVRDRNTDLRTAYAQVEVARGQARQALSGALPTLTATSSLNHHLLRSDGFDIFSGTLRTIPDPATTWSADVTLRVPVLTSRTWWDYGTAQDRIDLAELDATEIERQVIGALAESLVAVITAERLAEVTRYTLRAALSTLDLNRRRARLGSASAVDVLRAEQEVSRSRSQVIEADETARRAREALGLALGHREQWGVTPKIKLDQLGQDARETCTQGTSIDQRPDVRAARANAEVADRDVTSVDFSYVPEVHAETSLTYNSVARFSANQEHFTWTLGGVLTWRLYDGGLRYGQRTTAKGQQEIAQQQELATLRSASIEVERAFRNVTVAKTNLDVSVHTRNVARDSARLSQVKFVNGTGTSFDMVDTLRSLREAEIDVTIKQFDLLRAEIAAYLAIATCDI